MDPEEKAAEMDKLADEAFKQLDALKKTWTPEQKAANDQFIGWLRTNANASYKRLIQPLVGRGRFANAHKPSLDEA